MTSQGKIVGGSSGRARRGHTQVRSSTMKLFALSLVVLATACADRLPLVGAPCPCAAGTTCDTATQMCLPAPAPGVDGGASASPDAPPTIDAPPAPDDLPPPDGWPPPDALAPIETAPNPYG